MTLTQEILDAEKQYLANLLEAIQRCIYFLESLVAINECFAKLQDTFGAALRHAVVLLKTIKMNWSKISTSSTG